MMERGGEKRQMRLCKMKYITKCNGLMSKNRKKAMCDYLIVH